MNIGGAGFRLQLTALLIAAIAGCGPTYPKNKFEGSIVNVCKKEYKADVKVEAIGKTVAIYLPLRDLIDFNFSITKSASEKINDVILSVSRVALSSDAEFDFYVIIAHDVLIPEIQIVIIKSVDDVKRFLLNDISRSEYSKRMLIDIRMSPQAQKERSIKEIFERMVLDKKTQEQVLNDFFRSEPAALGDIGYWNNHFYIKDISLAEFIAEQIANRVRTEFREEKGLSDIFMLKSSKCHYLSKKGKAYFRMEIAADPRSLAQTKDAVYQNKVFGEGMSVSAAVTHNYRFSGFEYVEIIDVVDGKSVEVSGDDLELFRRKKLKLEEIVK